MDVDQNNIGEEGAVPEEDARPPYIPLRGIIPGSPEERLEAFLTAYEYWTFDSCEEAGADMAALCHADPTMFAEWLDKTQKLGTVTTALDKFVKELSNAERTIAVYIGAGPDTPSGGHTAIVSMGRERELIPVLEDETTPLDHEVLDNTGVCLISKTMSGTFLVGTLPDYQLPAEVIPIIEVTEDGKHAIVTDMHEGKVRLDIVPGAVGSVKGGDSAFVNKEHKLLLGKAELQESMSQWRMDSPRERFSDVGGLDSLVENINERVFYPLRYPDVVKTLGISTTSGVLLHGPPGCGKTLVAKAIAGELGEQLEAESVFLQSSAPEMKSMWYGQTAQNIKSLWTAAREQAAMGKVVVIFLDEADSLGGSRGSIGGGYAHHADTDATNTWLAEMDGLHTQSEQKIVCIAATNMLTSLDSAFTSRFGLTVPISRPDEDGLAKIVRIHLQGTPTTAKFDEMVGAVVEYVFRGTGNVVAKAFLRQGGEVPIKRSELVSGRMIREAVTDAKWRCFSEYAANKSRKKPKVALGTDHLMNAIRSQFAKTTSAMSVHNVHTYVENEKIHSGEVTRLVLV